ncbi:MAG TPA: gliding motility-associated C-terminal domain-containing protein [Bacteroidales bacterium]|nr:gliding motility-associated C-terminal domain-containing protein [Bacteroidales bacterium]HSA43129.1 gliding motility-associated C-terminal domain-containing protein [Bacteroidales bacterium]
MRPGIATGLTLFTCLLSVQIWLPGQNLVPNPGFEQYITCPTFASQLDLAAPWFNPSQGTPEFFHACCGYSSWVGVPSQPTGGFQYARTGNGFAGIYTFRSNIAGMREYMEVKLTDSLRAGRCYFFEMYVNQPNDHPLASDGIGVHFSVGEKRLQSPWVFGLQAHIDNPAGNFITDTLGWVRISGTYIAKGGEDHLIIGNFRDDAHTLWMPFLPVIWYENSAYLYVDDVYLGEPVLHPPLGEDTILCRGEEIMLSASGTGDSWVWSNGSTDSAILVNEMGVYWVDAGIGQCRIRDTIVIGMLDKPRIFLPADTILCSGEELPLDVACWGCSYEWFDQSTGPVYRISAPGTYWVRIYHRCDQDTAFITVAYRDCYCHVDAPNVFTPNGDGFNDVFRPEVDCRISNLRLCIYNRWGQLLFESDDPACLWDGKYGDKEAPAGVYFWYLDYEGNDNGQLTRNTKKGCVHLLR